MDQCYTNDSIGSNYHFDCSPYSVPFSICFNKDHKKEEKKKEYTMLMDWCGRVGTKIRRVRIALPSEDFFDFLLMAARREVGGQEEGGWTASHTSASAASHVRRVVSVVRVREELRIIPPPMLTVLYHL